jgi:hypothetical protein
VTDPIDHGMVAAMSTPNVLELDLMDLGPEPDDEELELAFDQIECELKAEDIVEWADAGLAPSSD